VYNEPKKVRGGGLKKQWEVYCVMWAPVRCMVLTRFSLCCNASVISSNSGRCMFPSLFTSNIWKIIHTSCTHHTLPGWGEDEPPDDYNACKSYAVLIPFMPYICTYMVLYKIFEHQSPRLKIS